MDNEFLSRINSNRIRNRQFYGRHSSPFDDDDEFDGIHYSNSNQNPNQNPNPNPIVQYQIEHSNKTKYLEREHEFEKRRMQLQMFNSEHNRNSQVHQTHHTHHMHHIQNAVQSKQRVQPNNLNQPNLQNKVMKMQEINKLLHVIYDQLNTSNLITEEPILNVVEKIKEMCEEHNKKINDWYDDTYYDNLNQFKNQMNVFVSNSNNFTNNYPLKLSVSQS